MKASVVDLRYRMKDVLKALRLGESVKILYHGKPVGLITPIPKKRLSKKEFFSHPFFGMRADDPESVDSIMERLRRPRYRDI